MTLDEFAALNLDASSHFLTLKLKGAESLIQPIKLHDPLPETDDAFLSYLLFVGKRKIFSAVPYEFSGRVAFRPGQVKLEQIESIVEMPFIVRNNWSSNFKT
ncbi:hypothetical protein [Larkinella terrae]|uniref:Uncharacterized protein n=1 Tax=Larkinella terrae TaxID=2025311 RepID=A0A7K0ELD3_9BACT|nr:hypothetical protein [Larkinella terrae]MRS62258.1 hypothetical protein [Larkinella terrae]